MSDARQRPEHMVIREYLQALRDTKRITREGLRDAFVPVFLEMIPLDDDVPRFEAVHRHDTADHMRRKDEANLKKLWRAIDGTTFFPLAFKTPLIFALDAMEQGMGLELHKLLLHNAGLLHLPIDTTGNTPVIYSEWLQEMAEANMQMVADANDDGIWNSEKTEKEVLDVIEKSFQVLREIQKNKEKQANGSN